VNKYYFHLLLLHIKPKYCHIYNKALLPGLKIFTKTPVFYSIHSQEQNQTGAISLKSAATLSPNRVLVPFGIGLALSLLGDQTLYTVLPNPNIPAQAGVSVAMVGVLLGLNRLTRIITNGPAGMLYDRLPRRGLMIAAVVIMHQHIPKGYIYFAMAFSVFVEMLNMRMRTKMPPKPVKLHVQYSQENSTKTPNDE
jgi:hypothetical protein